MKRPLPARRLACSCLLVVGVGLSATKTAAQEGVKEPPRLIKDITTLADGRHVDPAADPTTYPLSQSSYPESPSVVGQALFFVAFTDGGRRTLFRYDSLTQLVSEPSFGSVGVASAIPNPRSLAVSNNGQTLWLAMKKQDTVGEQAYDGVFAVNAAGVVTALPFQPAPTYVRVDSVAATSYGVEVIARAGSGPMASWRTALWRLTTGGGQPDRLTKVAETTGNTYGFEKVAHLVQVEAGAGTFYAFSAQSAVSTNRRLVLVDPVTAPHFREIGAPNPAMLTAVGGQLLFVEVAEYRSGQPDRLKYIPDKAATSASPAGATTRGIRGLVAAVSKGVPMLFFRASNGAGGSKLHYYEEDNLTTELEDKDGAAITSIASVVGWNDDVYVLGTREVSSLPETVLWTVDTDNASLVKKESFGDLVAPAELDVWSETAVRFAFVASETGTAARQPVLSVSTNAETWSTEPIADAMSGSVPGALKRVGNWLWFCAMHGDRGVEPWHWDHR